MTPNFAHVFTAAFTDWECQQGWKRALLSLVEVMCEPRKGVGPSHRHPPPHSSLSRLFTNPRLTLSPRIWGCVMWAHMCFCPSVCGWVWTWREAILSTCPGALHVCHLIQGPRRLSPEKMSFSFMMLTSRLVRRTAALSMICSGL